VKADCKWIERVIHARYSTHNPIVPGIAPHGWWECDIFSLTRAGYMHEFEIKVSRSDFKADFNKCWDQWRSMRHRGIKKLESDMSKEEVRASLAPVYKHDLMKEGYTKGPKFFWFCAPEGLLEKKDIPDHAGFIEFPEHNETGRIPWGMRVVKKAPTLHTTKFCEKRLKEMRARLVYRYQNIYFHDIPAIRQQIEYERAKSNETP